MTLATAGRIKTKGEVHRPGDSPKSEAQGGRAVLKEKRSRRTFHLVSKPKEQWGVGRNPDHDVPLLIEGQSSKTAEWRSPVNPENSHMGGTGKRKIVPLWRSPANIDKKKNRGTERAGDQHCSIRPDKKRQFKSNVSMRRHESALWASSPRGGPPYWRPNWSKA